MQRLTLDRGKAGEGERRGGAAERRLRKKIDTLFQGANLTFTKILKNDNFVSNF